MFALLRIILLGQPGIHVCKAQGMLQCLLLLQGIVTPSYNLVMSSETALQASITDIVKIPVRRAGFITHLIAIHDLMMSQSFWRIILLQ